MKNIGININSSKDTDGKILELTLNTIKNIIKDCNIKIFKDSVGLNSLENSELEVVISLGGDGTLLSTAREVFQYGVPLLGINIGNLGFLTEIEINEMAEALYKLKAENYYIEERLMLKALVQGASKEKVYFALNDVVLSKGTLARIAKYDISVDKRFYTTYIADGVIIATPTGSTAYSLSAGGPIVYPNLELTTVTPICPHSLGARTIVLDSSNEINVNIKNKLDSVYLTVDGQQFMELTEIDNIIISKAEKKCRLIKFPEYDYFKILRKKITSRTKECEGE